MRFLLIILILGISIATYLPFQNFLTKFLHYNEPVGFFGYLYGLTTSVLALLLSCVFWGSIILGASGKKTDYIIIGVLLTLSAWLFSQSGNLTIEMYLGLFGVFLLGNALGYMLKVGRQNWLGK